MADTNTKKKFNWKEALGGGAVIGAGAVAGQALKDAFTKPATWAETYASQLLKNQAAKDAALKAGSGIGAGIGKALTATVPTAAAVAIPALATGIGAYSIYNTKKKFDRELDANTTDTMKRSDALIKVIRDQRNQGTPALGRVTGQQEADLRKSNPEVFIEPVRTQFDTNTNYKNALRKYRLYGNWASNK